jgi:hypothetical protein
MPATSLLITHHETLRAQGSGRVGQLHPDIPETTKWFGSW